MDLDVDIRPLSHKFYTAYPQSEYPELMRKEGRPYTCLIIDSHDDYLICIPFRSSISHNEAFLFSGTRRAEHTRSGLDYKKLVLIKDSSFVSNSPAIVDDDEYTMVINNIDRISNDVCAYIQNYISHLTGAKKLHPREFSRRYRFSTLPYFHDILDIEL